MVDQDRFSRLFVHFELEPELLLERGKKGGSCCGRPRISRPRYAAIRGPHHAFGLIGRPGQVDVVFAVETGLVEHGAVELEGEKAGKAVNGIRLHNQFSGPERILLPPALPSAILVPSG